MAIEYPLEEILNIKKRRFDDAARVLEEKKKILEQEKTKLKQLEEERNRVLKHKNEKLTQLRMALDEGINTIKIQEMKRYLEIVDEKLSKQQQKVDTQKKQVKAAEEQVEVAKQDLLQKQKGLEKLKIHKKEWEKEQALIERKQEELKHDELGATIHELKKRENPHKKT